MKLAIVLVAASLSVSASPAVAHHSAAMFDRSKTIVLRATILEYKFTAPHAWISVMASADSAIETQRWDIEASSAGRMKSQGITPDRLKPGDQVTIRMHPLRDGRNGGCLLDLTLADGTKMIEK